MADTTKTLKRNTFNEATRVQMPILVHLTRLGYNYFGKINDNLVYTMSQAKQRRCQPSGTCSRKAAYRRCFIGRMPDSS